MIQRFVGCLIVGSKVTIKLLNDSLEHPSERLGVVQIQSTIGMHPRRRWIESTTFGPDLVRSLLPPTVVDSVLSALPFGNHCELARFGQLERRWAVTANKPCRCRSAGHANGPNRFTTSHRQTSFARTDGMVAEDVRIQCSSTFHLSAAASTLSRTVGTARRGGRSRIAMTRFSFPKYLP